MQWSLFMDNVYFFLTQPVYILWPRRRPEASEVAAMMSTGMRIIFQSGIQKNLKSLYRGFVPQKFASAQVVQTGITGKQVFSSKRSIQTRLDCVVKPMCPKSAVKINIGTLVQSL